MPSALDLKGRVTITTGGAVSSVKRLSEAFRELDVSSKANLGVSEKTARAFAKASAAASSERAAVANLARAQQGYNKELAQTAVLQERANATKRGSLASAYATRTTAKAKAGAITSDAAGRTVLAEQRALTEEVRRTALAQDAQGRAALRAAQIQSVAARDQIAAQRAVTASQRASHIGSERAATALDHVSNSAIRMGTLGVGAFIGITANAVIMEKQFAAVVRTSDIVDTKFASIAAEDKAIGRLRTQFDSLAQSLPISYRELTEIGTAANQLGIQTGSLASFTKAVAQFSATTGVSVDTASTAFGRLNSLVTDVTRNGQVIKGSGVDNNFQGLADSINKVGVESAATDQQIINIASQIAGVANAAGLSSNEIIGFSGALASVAVSPYLARGATTRLFTNIGNAVAQGGNRLEDFARVSGVSAKQFADDWSNAPDKALVNLFQGINRSGKDAVNVMADLGIKSVLDQPALLRVAKLADQAGNSGQGLAEAFKNAANAAGENERQYRVIADTVQARLQVALNRVQILFRNIGDSNLGPLGEAISGLSKGALQLSQNLDKPVKLLDQFDLPFTNGELLGGIVTFAGIAGAITLVVGVGAKLVSTFLRVKTATAALRQALGSVTGSNAQYAASANVAAAAAERQAAAMAAAARVGQRQPLALAAGPSAAVKPTRTFAVDSSGTATIKNTGAEATRITGLLSRAGAAGSAAGTRIVGGFRAAGGAIRGAGSALSSFVGGPVGVAVIALGAAAGAVQFVGDKFAAVGTQAGDAAVNISHANTALQLTSQIRIGADSFSGLTNDKTKAFLTNAKDLRQGLENVGAGGLFNDLGAKFKNFTGQFTDSGLTFQDFTTGLHKLDDGFQRLADSGNLDGAVAGIQTLFKGQSPQAVVNGLAQMDSATSILRLKLDQSGKSAGKNDENIYKLAQTNDILTAAQQRAATQAEYQTKAFNGNAEAAATSSEAQTKLIASATDLAGAYQNASAKGPASFAQTLAQLKKQYQDLQDAQSNALKIALATDPSSFDELSQLPPTILAEAAKSKKAMGQLVEALNTKEAATAFNTGLEAIAQNPQLGKLFTSLGPKLKAQLLKSLSQGQTIEQAFAGLGPKLEAAYNKAVQGTQLEAPPIKPPKLVLPSQIASPLDAYKIKVDADTSSATTKVQEVNGLITNSHPYLTAGANTAPATGKVNDALGYINNSKGTVTVDANAALAQGKSESTVAYINRLEGIVTINGNGSPGRRAGESTAAYINRLKGTITAYANTSPAETALRNLTASRTVTLQIAVAGGAAAGAAIAAAAGAGGQQRANGGFVYGKGTSTSDSIPAMLSNGEFVVRAVQARKYAALLTKLNNSTAGYAGGGFVNTSANYNASYASRPNYSNSSGISVTELSAYDRHLLTVIADNIGVTIAPNYIAQATTGTFRKQAQRGNG